MEDVHRAVSAQSGGNFGCAPSARGIAIQHEDHTLESLQQDSLLRLVQGRSHNATTDRTPAWRIRRQSKKPPTGTTTDFAVALARWRWY